MSDFSISGIIEVSRQQLDDARDAVSRMGEEATETFSRVGSQIETAFAGLAGVGALSIGGVAAFTEIDQALNDITAQTANLNNVTFDVGDAFDSVYASAGRQGIESVTTAVTLSATALERVSDTANVAAGDVDLISTSALQLSDRFANLEVEDSIQIMTNLMDHFGLSAEESGDLVASAFSSSLGSSDDLADTLKEYPRYFADMDFSAQEMLSTLESTADAWGTDYGADLLKEWTIRHNEWSDDYISGISDIFSSQENLLNDTVQQYNLELEGIMVPDLSSEALKDLNDGIGETSYNVRQITMEDLADPFIRAQYAHRILDQNVKDGHINQKELFDVLNGGLREMDGRLQDSAAVRLFGTKAEDLVNFQETINTATGTFDNFDGKLAEIVETTTSVQDEFDTLRRVSVLALADIGQQISTSIDLSGIISSITDFVSRARNAFANLPDSAKSAIGVFAAISAAIAAVAPFIGVITSAFAAFNPVTVAVIASVAALSGAFVAVRDLLPRVDFGPLSEAASAFMSSVQRLFGVLKDVSSIFINTISSILGFNNSLTSINTESFSSSLVSAIQFVSDSFSSLISFAATSINNFSSLFSDFFPSDFFSDISTNLLNLSNPISDTLQSIVAHGSTLVAETHGTVNRVLAGIGVFAEAFGQIFAQVRDAVSTITLDDVMAGLEVAGAVVGSVASVIIGHITFMKDVAVGALTFLYDVISQVDFSPITTAIMPLIASVGEFALTIGGAAVAIAGHIVSVVSSLGSMAGSGAGMIDLSGIIAGAINVAISALGAFMNFVTLAFQTVTGVINGSISPVQAFVGLWQAQLSLINTALTTVLNAMASAVSAIGGALFAPIADGARALGGAISSGFSAAISAVSSGVSSMIASARAGMSSMANAFSTSMSAVGNAVANGFNAAKGAVVNGVSSMVASARAGMKSMSDAFTTALTTVRGAITSGFNAARSVVVSGVAAMVSGAVSGMSAMKNAFVSSMNAVRNAMTSGFNAVRGAVASGMAAMLSVVTSVMSTIRTAFTSGINAVRGVMSTGFNVIKGVVTFGMNVLVTKIQSSWDTAKRVFNQSVTSVLNQMRQMVDGVRSRLTEMSNVFSNITSTIQSQVTRAWNSLVNTIRTNMTNALNAVKTELTSMVGAFQSRLDSIQTTVTAGLLNIGSSFRDTLSSILSNVTGSLDSLKSLFSTKLGQVVSGVTSSLSGLSGAIVTAINGAFSAASGALGSFFSIGVDMVGGMVSGVLSAASNLAAAAVSTVNDAISSAASALGIASPSKVAEDRLGEPLGQGVELGMVKSLDGLGDTLSSNVTDAIDSVSTGAPIDFDVNGTVNALDFDLPDLSAVLGGSVGADLVSNNNVNITVTISSDDTLADQLSEVLTDTLGTQVDLADGLGLF